MRLSDIQPKLVELMQLAAKQPKQPKIVRRILGDWVQQRIRSASIKTKDHP